MQGNPLECLAKYISDFSLEKAPAEVLKAAKNSTMDSVGSALGGKSYGEVPDIVELFSSFSNSEEKSASVWGTGKRTSVFQAALLNGVLGHSLELDDVHTGSKTHIGAVVLPAAWSVGEALRASGKKLLEAVIVGYETMARIGEGFGVSEHRLRGWHVTGTAGTFGAAAATAKIMDLDAKRTLFALGMAGTQSSGLWAFLEDGSTSKKLHTGRAAENGVVAAFLALAGMTGPEHILDAQDGGLYRATSDSFNMDAVSRQLGTRFEILNVDRKPYACCRSMHPPIDAILALRNKKAISALSISKITVRTYEVAVKQCGVIFYPKNASEAKFSMRFGIAAAFIDGAAGQDQFSDEKILSPEIKELAEKVEIFEDKNFTSRYPGKWGCSVEVETTDGKKIEKTILDASGSVANPLSDEQLVSKFTALTKKTLGEEKCRNLIEIFRDIENISVIPSI